MHSLTGNRANHSVRGEASREEGRLYASELSLSWCPSVKIAPSGLTPLHGFLLLPGAGQLLGGARDSLVVVQPLKSFPTLWDPMNCSTPGFPVHHQPLELAQTHVHWVSDAIQPSHLSSPSPLALNLSQPWGLLQWVSSSNKYSGLVSFRMDWFDLLEVQGTLKSLLQHHSSKASILQHSAFFMVQLSHHIHDY